MKRFILTLSAVFLILAPLSAQKDKLQAAYIYQFTKLIQWCTEYKSGEFIIGVLGNSSVTNELNVFKGKTVGSQVINVVTYSSPEEMGKCNILFLPEDQSGQFNAIKRKIGKKCTLLIAEKRGLATRGAAIGFIFEGGKVQYEVNLSTFQQQSLTSSDRLLTSAKAVYKLNE
jgi:hypothetical protein